MKHKRKSTAFVLSGGASLGAIQAGMLEALFERGISADLIIGTSARAVNGAFIATRPQTVQTARELGRIWRGLSRGKVFPLNPVTGALGFFGARSHLVPDSGLRRLVEQHATVERLEQTGVPLHVIATDVLSGDEVRLSRGPLVDAVLASAAIPGVFPAVDWDGRPLIDGGVSNNVPLSHAIELGADRIFVLPTAPCELNESPRGALPMLLYATGLLIGRRLQAEAGGGESVGRPGGASASVPIAGATTDFSRAEELIKRGRHEARRYLQARALTGNRLPGRRPRGSAAARARLPVAARRS